MNDPYAGWHLTYDAIVEEDHAANLVDLDFLRGALLDATDLLGMQVLVGPELRDVPLDPDKGDSDLDEGGVMGTVVATMSHLAIHTWPLRQRFNFDVFSCRKFDGSALDVFLAERFCVRKRSTHWIVRTWP